MNAAASSFCNNEVDTQVSSIYCVVTFFFLAVVFSSVMKNSNRIDGTHFVLSKNPFSLLFT